MFAFGFGRGNRGAVRGALCPAVSLLSIAAIRAFAIEPEFECSWVPGGTPPYYWCGYGEVCCREEGYPPTQWPGSTCCGTDCCTNGQQGCCGGQSCYNLDNAQCCLNPTRICSADKQCCGALCIPLDALCCDGAACGVAGWDCCDDGGCCPPGQTCSDCGCLEADEACCGGRQRYETETHRCCEDDPDPLYPVYTCLKESTCCAGNCADPPDVCCDGHVCYPDYCGEYSCDCVNCDDNNPCTTDHCQVPTGCYRTFNTLPCNDGDACTINDHCQGGVCGGGGPRPCDNGLYCDGYEGCDPATGCTQGTPIDCNDGNPCTEDRCNEPGGCQHGCIAGNFRGAPEPPDADDRTFISQVMDQQASPGQTEMMFPVFTTRYAGPTHADNPQNPFIGGTLVHANALVSSELAAEYAEIFITAKHVNTSKLHYVAFNGQWLGSTINPVQHLSNASCGWHTSRFVVRLDRVRFPAAPGNGGPPTPKENTIRIVIDGQPDCLKVHAVWLKVKLMSPIILIHGNGSNPAFFDRQGFMSDLHVGLVRDNTIQLAANLDPALRGRGRIYDNAEDLRMQLLVLVASYGVDSIHLVAHSKGGLDTRDFLGRHYETVPFDVLSLTTLSTPHDGSVLADIMETYEAFLRTDFGVRFSGSFPTGAQLLSRLVLGNDEGRVDLTVKATAAFNAENVRVLPEDVQFNTLAADADRDGTGTLNTLGEIDMLHLEDQSLTLLPPLGAILAVNHVYQILRQVERVDVQLDTRFDASGVLVRTAHVIGIAPALPSGNDALVTLRSGRGDGGFNELVSNHRPFIGALGRNHATIADVAVYAILSWLVARERTIGDLR